MELVDDRYEDFQSRRPPLLGWVSDDFFNCGLVLGPPMDVAPLALDAARGAMWAPGADGAEQCVGEGSGADIIDGHPLNSLVWLANSEVARALGGLPRGWIVSLCSVTRTAWLASPDARVRVEFRRSAEPDADVLSSLEVSFVHCSST